MKLIGGLFLLVAATGYGFSVIRAERRRLALTEALLALIRTTERRIVEEMLPLPAIFAAYHSDILADCGFLARCRTDGIRAAWDVLRADVPTDAVTVLDAFATGIGCGSRDAVLALCRRTSAALETLCETMRAARRGRERLWGTLPPLAVLSVLLLLL